MVRTFLLGAATALTTLVFAVSGCSVNQSVGQAKVEDAIKANLASQVNGQIEDVSCPGDLKSTVGATMQCTMTVDGQEHKVDVTVDSVEGTTVNFNMRVVD